MKILIKPKRSHLHFKSTPEILSQISKTETSGMRSHTQNVNAFIEAGIRSDEFREEYYDYRPDEQIDPRRPLSPTRRWDYDMAEASQDLLAVEERLEQTKKEALEAKAVKDALENQKIPPAEPKPEISVTE